MSWKRPFFTLLAFAIFFTSTELMLRLSGVRTLTEERDPFQGFSDTVRVYELDAARGVYRTRPAAIVHTFNHQEFLADKPEDGFRFFVLGGSSAYGFPWGARVAFPRLLGRALQASWPEREIEAVNAAAMSYGSHRLRILARELLLYRPDLLIVYGGHNEFVERRFYRRLLERTERLDGLRRALYGLRSFSAMTRLYERLTLGSREHEHDRATTGDLLGLDVDREYSADVGRKETEEAQRAFRENLDALLDHAARADVPVILCTVPSNLEGWQPNQSIFDDSRTGEDRAAVQRLLDEDRRAVAASDAPAALQALEKARALAPEHAIVHFRLGQIYETLGRGDAARASFLLARDTDGQPSRAVTVLNDTIRDVATARGALLVDIERTFTSVSERSAPGFDLFEDYVHPNRRGHRLIALELWRALMLRGVLGPPRIADPAEFEAALEAADGSEEADVPRRSPTLVLNLALVLENQGLFDQAISKYREAIEIDERYYFARLNLGRLLHLQGRFDEAAREFETALTDAANDAHRVRALVGMGEALQSLGSDVAAASAFRSATVIDPRSRPAWANLGEALAAASRYDEATVAFRTAVELDPDNASLIANLGFSLLAQRELEKARSAFERAIELRPGDRRGHNGLAAVLTETGQLEDAERVFLESLRLDPRDGFARGGLDIVRARRAARSQSGDEPGNR